jgi:hypothetical protein
MDISTFYALSSATCFVLLGFWWDLLRGDLLSAERARLR